MSLDDAEKNCHFGAKYQRKIALFQKNCSLRSQNGHFLAKYVQKPQFFARSARKKYEKGVFGAAHQRKTNLGRLPLETFFGLETPMDGV